MLRIAIMKIMKNAKLICLLFICSYTCLMAQESKNANPTFGFSGIEEFWKIVDILQTDVEPTEKQWQAMFDTPGYARLVVSEFKPEYFKRILGAVFKPSLEDQISIIIDEYKQKGGFLGWYTSLVVEGYQEAKRDREWLNKRMEELRTYPYLEKASQEALKLLPEDTGDEYPGVEFIVFSDSRGYDPMIIGLTGKDELSPQELECLQSQGYDHHRPLVLLLAHEAFHLYRNQKLEFEFPDTNHADYSLVWLLDQIENEGIGDLVNCKELYFNSGCLRESRLALNLQKEQKSQPAFIRIIDGIFAELNRDPELVSQLGRSLLSFVPRSGHPTGFFMAKVILEQYGKDEIIKVARNPFRFFSLYNDAAKKSGMGPVFSEETMDFISSLEQKYGNR